LCPLGPLCPFVSAPPGPDSLPSPPRAQQGALLWTYEGLTQHLGLLLSARSGFWTPERRRSTDFYDESLFLWLDVDTLLRERSAGKVTLDDFCRQFHGGADSGPAVVPYGREESVRKPQRPAKTTGKASLDVESHPARAPSP